MNIFSCNGCGGVFDLDKIDLPEQDTYGDEGTDLSPWEWDGDKMVPCFVCPICQDQTPVDKG